MLLSGYTTSFDAIARDYPILQCVQQLLEFCDEVVVVDAGSRDGTRELLSRHCEREPRLRLFDRPVDFDHPRWALAIDGKLKAFARDQCRGSFCFQADLDEIVADDAGATIRSLCDHWPDDEVVLAFPFVEYWGSVHAVRADIPTCFPRLSRNLEWITHDVPLRARRFDRDGELHVAPYESDSCEYVHRVSYEPLRVVPLVDPTLDALRQAATDSALERSRWQIEFNRLIERIPTVFHLSWLDVERKLSHYRDHWPRFHASLFDVDVSDCPPAPGGRAWAELDDEELRLAAARFVAEGPRVLHGAARPGPTIRVGKLPPRVVWDWIEARSKAEALYA